MANIFIPTKLHIGFRSPAKSSTTNIKQGYVTYEDVKGVRRKESSWSSFIQSGISPMISDNEPSKFVIKKPYKYSSGIYLHDVKRNFEFEITLYNFLSLIEHTDIVNQTLTEECVFGFKQPDSELVILSTKSPEYKDAIQYTEKQTKKVTKKQLLAHVGCEIILKNSDKRFIYLGMFNHTETTSWNYYSSYKNRIDQHVFCDIDNKFYTTSRIENVSYIANEQVHPNYQAMLDGYHKTKHSEKIVKFETTFNEELANAQSTYRATQAVYNVDNDGAAISKITDGYGRTFFQVIKLVESKTVQTISVESAPNDGMLSIFTDNATDNSLVAVTNKGNRYPMRFV